MRDVAIAAVVFLVAMARSLGDGFGLSDESWFLQVLSRLAAGDVLYRDVAIGVTPLSVYVTSWATAFTGLEIVAVKLVTNACFATTAFIAARTAAAAGLPRGTAWIVAAAMLVWGRPHANPPYTAMAITMFAAAAWCALANRWLAAGIAAGLSLAAKQNAGALALVVVAIAAATARSDSHGRRIGGALPHVAGGVALALGAVILPVAISGGLGGLWDYGVAAKTTYVQTAAVSYVASVTDWFGSVGALTSREGWSRALHGVTVVLPIAAALAVALTWRRLDRRGRLLALCAAAATLTALPRWDRFHMTYAVPFHVLAIASAWAVRQPRPAAIVRFVPVTLAIAVALVIAPAVTALANGHRPSTLDRFRGPLLPPGRQAELLSAAAALRDAAASRALFILDPEAGFWYLASGLSNPTPFDIPATTSIGTAGVPWLLSRLEDGRLEQVCLAEAPVGPLALESVAHVVRERYAAGPDAGPCRIYRSSRHPVP